MTITDSLGNQTQETLSTGEPTTITKAYGTSYATTTAFTYFPNTDGTASVTTASGTANAETTTYTYNSAGDLTSKPLLSPRALGPGPTTA